MNSRFTAADRVLSAAREAKAQELPRRLCRALCEGLPVDEATVAFLTDTPYRQLLCASGELALRLEEAQFVAGEGPCVSAAATGRPVLVEDFGLPLPQWPLFEAHLDDRLAPVGAVYAFPLAFDGKVFGSVDLLRHEPLELDAPTVGQAEAAARAVAKVLFPAFWELLAFGDLPLWEPADEIDAHWGTTRQAAQRLSAKLGISVEEAMARLRGQAFTTGRPLPRIAEEVLDPPSRD